MLTRERLDSRIGSPYEKYDVLVAGGGPAGLGAALAAAKAGARTVLLEARGYLGGVAANALWMPFNRLLLDGGSRGDIHNALVEKLKSLGPDACRPGKSSWVDGDGLHIHPEFLRLASLELLEDFGCHYVLYSPVSGVEMEGNRLKAAVASYKTHRDIYYADVFIDCTGDGDLAYQAGAKTEIGRREDGSTMFVTLGFSLANVDVDRLLAFTEGEEGKMRLDEILGEAQAAGYCCSDWYSFDRTTLPGVVSVNNGGLKA